MTIDDPSDSSPSTPPSPAQKPLPAESAPRERRETVRVAVCQITCHPAATQGSVDFESELFGAVSSVPSLSELAREELDVAVIKKACRIAYREWHARRLQKMLESLATLNPIPDLILFPECSIALPLLHPIRDFAIKHHVTVVAGTHPFHPTQDNLREYRHLRIDTTTVKEWEANPAGGLGVLPVFNGRSSIFRRKIAPSVFELTDVTATVAGPTPYDVHELECAGQTVRTLNLVCSEALQQHYSPAIAKLVLIVAYSPNPTNFEPTIQRFVSNGIPVAFCNDGRYGGSGIFAAVDNRAPSWWWRPPISGHLPPGDSLLVADLDLTATAPQVGVMNPKLPLRLVRLATITGDDGRLFTAPVAESIQKIALENDPAVRADLIRQVVEQQQPSRLQQIRLRELRAVSENGDPAPDLWEAIGSDIVLKGVDDLGAIEHRMAASASKPLDALIEGDPDIADATMGKLVKLAKRCKKAAAELGPLVSLPIADAPAAAPIDRHRESNDLTEFLAHRTQSAIVLSGLDGIGKSTVLQQGLARSGHKSIQIVLTPDSTPQFIAESLLLHVGYRASVNATEDPIKALNTPEFASRVPPRTVLIIVDTDNLTSHGQWRDDQTLPLIRSLAKTFAATAGKLVLVSATRLPIDQFDIEQLQRPWLKGLEPQDGALLLDQHLRRANLNPDDFEKVDRQTISKYLVGHPEALILAAGFIVRHGMNTVLEDLKARRGVHAQIVRHILRRLSFTDTEWRVLTLLNAVRTPIPPRLLNDFCDENAVSIAYELVELSVLERFGDRVALSGMLRGYAALEPLPEDLLQRFHAVVAAYFSQSARASTGSEQLRYAVESQYHAVRSGDPSLAVSVPGLADGLLSAVRDLMFANKEDQARDIIEELLKQHPTPEVYELATQVYARLGRIDEAFTLAKETLSLSPSKKWIIAEVGKWAIRFRRSDIAREAVDLARKIGHETAFVATFVGRLYLQEGNLLAALDALRRAVAISESERYPDAIAYYYLGRELVKIDEKDEAIEVLYKGELIEAGSRRPRRWLLVLLRTQLGLVYTFAGDLKNAERIFKLVVDEDPGNPEVARTFAFYRAATGAKDAAIKALTDMDPSKARDRYERCRTYLYRALFLLNLGHRERAATEFELAHQQDPRNLFVLLKWARTLVEMARDSDSDDDREATRYIAEQAKFVAEKVLNFDRDNTEALKILERLSDEFSVQ